MNSCIAGLSSGGMGAQFGTCTRVSVVFSDSQGIGPGSRLGLAESTRHRGMINGGSE
jgi:hypothetical protein